MNHICAAPFLAFYNLLIELIAYPSAWLKWEALYMVIKQCNWSACTCMHILWYWSWNWAGL